MGDWILALGCGSRGSRECELGNAVVTGASQPSSHHLTLNPMMRKLNEKGSGCLSEFCTWGVSFL